MKKIFILTNVLLIALFVNAQYPSGRLYPVNQSIGADSTLVTSRGGLKGRIINWSFVDTTAANLQPIKNYAGAQIFTTSDTSIWLRNVGATKWVKPHAGSGTVTSFTFLTDSSLVICYSDGVCDTLSFNNNVFVTNNNVSILNDSTLLICTGSGATLVCDTISLGIDSVQNFYFLNDSTVVACDSTQTICVGDSCYTQQLCDTIPIPKITGTIYQNGVRKTNNIVEWGVAAESDNTSYIYHSTYLKTGGVPLYFIGGPPNLPLFNIRNNQWTQISPYITSFEHDGAYHPGWGLLDSANDVQLNVNYTDPFYIPTLGTLAGDTIGYMGNRYGYMLVGNLPVKSNTAKQAGIFIDTYSPNTEGVTIFANQTPQNFFFYHIDSTLFDKRVAVFHTDKSSNFLGKVYLTDGRFETYLGTSVTAANDLVLSNGNVFPILGNTQINAIDTTNWQSGSVVTFEFTSNPTLKHNTFGGVNTAPLFLAGAADYTAANGDMISFAFDGTRWHEIGRALASGAAITGITADNGLTASTATNVQLGGTLIQNTTIATGGFFINLTTSTASATPLTILSSNGGSGMISTAIGSAGSVGVGGNTDIGFGVQGYASGATGFGISGYVDGGAYPLDLTNLSSSTNTVLPMAYIHRETTGTAADGIGESLDFYLETDNTAVTLSNQIISKLTTAANATRTSQLDITGVNSAATGTIASFYGSGVVGIGILSGYAASRLEVVDNSVASSMVKLTSSSTAAAGNIQRLLDVQLTGANATSSQNTRAIFANNAHTGTGSTNFGLDAQARDGDTNYGIGTTAFGGSVNYGISTTVANSSTINYGIFSSASGSSATNYGAYIQASGGTNNYAIIVPAASGNVGIGTSSPSANALLELSSTTQAFIVMRMTATEGSAITPAAGMIIFVTNTNGTFTSVGFWGYDGSAWAKF